MTNLTKSILDTLYLNGGALTSYELRDRVAPHMNILDFNDPLHDLQDTGDILMRNGFYRLSEKGKTSF